MSSRPGFGGGGSGGGPPGPPGPAGPDSNVYWSPAGFGNALTDADVVALCATGPKVIHLIDGNAAVYNWGIVGDVKGSVFYAPSGDPGERFLIVHDNAKIRNVGRGQFDGNAFSGAFTLRFDNDTTVSLEWDGFPAPSWNAGCKVENIGLHVAIDLVAGPNSFIAIGLSGGATVGTCTSPILRTNGQSVIIHSKILDGNGVVDPLWLQTQATDNIVVLSDGSFDFRQVPLWALSLGTVSNAPMALDGGQGTASFRPSGAFPFSPFDGCRYFNTETNQLEVYNVAAAAWYSVAPKGPGNGYSPISRAENGSYVVSLTAGDINVARDWAYDDLLLGQQCTGMRFYWPGGGGPLSVRCRLYSAGGTVTERSVDVAVDGAGTYDAVWPPFALDESYSYQEMSVATWETSGTWYAEVTAFSGMQDPSGVDGFWRAAPGLWWHRTKQGAGNTDPVAGFGGTFLAMEPVVGLP